MDHFENQGRRDNLILSGKKLNSLTNIKQNIVDLMKRNLNVNLSLDTVVAAHKLGPRPASQSDDRRNILVKLSDVGIRRDTLASCHRAKPTDPYANEDLTQSRASKLYVLRQAK